MKKIYLSFITIIMILCVSIPAFASGTCNHVWSNWEETSAKSWSTLDTDTGIAEYQKVLVDTKKCSICQEEETRDRVVDYQKIIEKHSASCTESGYAIVDHNGVISDRIITAEPLGHNFQSTGQKVEEKVTDTAGNYEKRIYDVEKCSRCNAENKVLREIIDIPAPTEVSGTGHNHRFSNWEYYDSTEWGTDDPTTNIKLYEEKKVERRYCFDCKKEEFRTTENYQRIKEVHKEDCSKDSYAMVDTNGTIRKVVYRKAGHRWSDWDYEKLPTATSEGTKVRKCLDCNQKETIKVPKTKSEAPKTVSPQKPTKTTMKATVKGKTSYTLKKGKSIKIKVTIQNKIKGQKVKYKSSNKKIASVSSKGKIKAKKKGKCTITVTYGKLRKKIKIKVK